MKHTARIALLLTALLLISCGNDSVTDAGSTSQTLSGSDTVDTAVTERVPAPTHLPEVDYTGETFTILYCGEENAYALKDIIVDGIDGEIVNDTVYERNLKLEGKYGITLAGIPKTDASETAKQEILGGSASFDIISDQLNDLNPLAVESYLYDWYSLEYFDPSYAWWDSNAAEELSIGGRLYMTVSDVSMSASSGARFLYINKNVASMYDLELPYDIVRDGKWTWDKMLAMITAVSVDLNGDGKMDGDDRFGLFTEHDEFFLTGCGVLYTVKDENDIPTLTLMSDHSDAAVTAVKELFDNKTNTISFDDASKGRDISGFRNKYDYCRSLFATDHTLFIQNGANAAIQFANMESEYGILPNPKFTEDQESYYHLVDPYSCAWAIPTTNERLEMTDVLMNYWGYLSSNSLVDAFYETTMKYKRLNAPDDADMLDIIRGTIRYEISLIADVGVTDVLDSAVKNGNLASTYEKKHKSIEKKFNALIEDYMNDH